MTQCQGEIPPPGVNVTLAFAQVDDTGMTQDGEMDNTNQSQGNETGVIIRQYNKPKNDGNNEEGADE